MRSPSPSVLESFGLRGETRPVRGGQGTCWEVDGAVLKPDQDPDLVRRLGTELAEVDQEGFLLPSVLSATNGSWVVDGWSASAYVGGSGAEDGPVDWRALVEAARCFHRATARLPCPDLVARRDDPWARADRAVWGEETLQPPPVLAPLAERLRRTIGAATSRQRQVVHADLAGNVLLAPGQTPAIIDVSPVWRPVSYAEGIVVADAVCWHGADPDLGPSLDIPTDDVARGLLFRVLVLGLLHDDGERDALVDQARRHTRAADVLGL